MRDATELERKLRALAHEATSLADNLRSRSGDARVHMIAWGILALNGWMSDVRDEGVKVTKAAQQGARDIPTPSASHGATA